MIEVFIKKEEQKKNFLHEHVSSILTFFVALAAVLVSSFQFLHTKDQAEIQKLMSERTYYNDSLKSLRDFNQRAYEYKDSRRLALTKFIAENEAKLTSSDGSARVFFINLITSTYGEESIDLLPLLNALRVKSVSKSDVMLLQNNVTEIRANKLSQLYEPLVIGFAESKSLYEGYKASNYSYKYARLIAENNKRSLRVLLSNDKFVPEYLKQDARALIEHFTVWTAAFDQKARESKPNNDNANFRVVYSSRTFPDISAQRFTEEYYRLGGK